MNDKLKNAEQSELISKYQDKLKQMVDDAYNIFSSNQNVDDFKRAIDVNVNEVLLEIKNTFLLNNEQKDNLFKQYYNLLIDGCDNIKDLNNKHDVRQIIFSSIKEKRIFHDPKNIIELVNEKFKQELEETQRKILQERQLALLKQQQEEKAKQIKNDAQNGEAKNTMQREESIRRYAVNNINQQNGNIPSAGGIGNNINYFDNNIVNKFSNQRIVNDNSQVNWYNLPQNVDFEGPEKKQTFSSDDFYRYQNVNNVITESTHAMLDNEYNFVRNEIKNSKSEKNSFSKNINAGGADSDKSPNLTQKDSNALMNLLRNIKQQQGTKQDNIKQAYNKTNKEIQNPISNNDDKVVDKNDLNSKNAEQKQI